jgi:hypothetical protein
LAVLPSVPAGVAVRLPNAPDHAALAVSLAGLGVAVERRRPRGKVDVAIIRTRFGLDPNTVLGWEQGRFTPVRPGAPSLPLSTAIPRRWRRYWRPEPGPDLGGPTV